jgi:hypothetical protein
VPPAFRTTPFAICHPATHCRLSGYPPFPLPWSTSGKWLATCTTGCDLPLTSFSRDNLSTAMLSSAGWQAQLMSLVPHPGATVLAPIPCHGQSLQGSDAAHAPRNTTKNHLPTTQRNVCGRALGAPSRSFFRPAQAHVGESALFASVSTNIPSQNARSPSSGTAPLVPHGRTSRGSWSQQTASPSALIGRSQGDASPQVTRTGTVARAVEGSIMGPRAALEQRRHNPLTPYNREAWVEELLHHGLHRKYPLLVQGLTNGFSLGIPQIRHTYAPPNHPSLKLLHDIYISIVDNEFAAGCYIGPFTRSQLEADLGPFQTSPLSLVPKTSKPGKYRAVHNFSHPHSPQPEAFLVNSHINSDDFPCTWGTFSTMALLIACLPPGSQAAIRDVAEAYRTIPVMPAQWPGLVVRLQVEDQFAVNTCNKFGLASAGGVYGMVADAGADIF